MSLSSLRFTLTFLIQLFQIHYKQFNSTYKGKGMSYTRQGTDCVQGERRANVKLQKT